MVTKESDLIFDCLDEIRKRDRLGFKDCNFYCGVSILYDFPFRDKLVSHRIILESLGYIVDILNENVEGTFGEKQCYSFYIRW